MFCSSCGLEIPGDSTFCPNCGEKVDAISTSSLEEPVLTPDSSIITIQDGDLSINPTHNQANPVTAQQKKIPAPSTPGVAIPGVTPKPWYRSTGILVMAFLFFTPAWSILMLTDKAAKSWVKAIATILLGLQGTCCLLYFSMSFFGAIAGNQGF